MDSKTSVIDDTRMSNSFLGNTIQVCVVTADLQKTCEGFLKMGIGPWRVYTFGPDTVQDLRRDGKPARFSMRLALATSGTMMWEVIEPLEGDSIYKQFLARGRDGVQHVGQDCQGLDFDAQVEEFERRGLRNLQSGNWEGVRFAYFGTEDLIGTTIEIFDFPADFVWPTPERWIPSAPPSEQA